MFQKFIILTSLLLVFNVGSVLACTCGYTPSVAQAKREADIVFLGEAADSKYQKGAVFPNGKDAGEELTIRFEVERWWKGGNAADVVLFTEQYQSADYSISVSTCAFQFDVGERYVVYARRAEDGKLRATYCSRTSKAEKAKEDLKQLGKGRNPKIVTTALKPKKA